MSGNTFDYEQIVHDERGYLRWLEENPTGHVVNSYRRPTANDHQLHRPSCKRINKGVEDHETTGDSIKTCPTDPANPDAWEIVHHPFWRFVRS